MKYRYVHLRINEMPFVSDGWLVEWRTENVAVVLHFGSQEEPLFHYAFVTGVSAHKVLKLTLIPDDLHS